MAHLNRKPLYTFIFTSCMLLAANSHAQSSVDAPQLVAKNLNTSVIADTVENAISLSTAQDTDSSFLEIVSQPSNGVLTFSETDSTVQYTPDSGFVGSDTYSYRVSNELETSNTATVTVDVIAANPVNTISNFISNDAVSVNGNIGDWARLNLFDFDPVDVPFGSTDRIDVRRAGVSHANDTAYIVYENRNIVDPDNTSNGILVWGWQAYLDTDNNPSSGFQLNDEVGADYLAEGEALYRYNGNGTTWSWVKVGDTNPQFQTNVVELSFERRLLGSHSNVKVAFVGNNRAYGGTSVDFYPEDSGFAYSFGNSFVGVATEPVVEQGTETSSNTNNPFETTAAPTNTINNSRSSSGGGGSISWLFLMLPSLLVFRRFRD